MKVAGGDRGRDSDRDRDSGRVRNRDSGRDRVSGSERRHGSPPRCRTRLTVTVPDTDPVADSGLSRAPQNLEDLLPILAGDGRADAVYLEQLVKV